MDYIRAGLGKRERRETLNAVRMRGAEGEWQRGDHGCHPLGLNRAAVSDVAERSICK
jgi:hypothetical protein